MHFYLAMQSMTNSPDENPKVTRALLRRVLGYARPYRRQILLLLILILSLTALMLLPPLILRDLIDRTIPAGDYRRLALLAGALLAVPAVRGALNVAQRQVSSQVGEGVIFDLRLALYSNLLRMSLRFFTNTKTGELMSRLNNDVVGAQNAISNTLVGIVANIIQAAAMFTIMLMLEWRLTFISIVVLPLFIFAARRLGARLRDLARQQMEANARMNAMMSETLNIGGALLVKLFGRKELEEERFGERAGQVRLSGIQRSVIGSVFIAIVGLLSAVGTALVYGLGGYYAIRGAFTVGAIVAFGSYLGNLYSALQSLANMPVEFATSMVSFERVFEIIDLPVEIPEVAGPIELQNVHGEIVFEDVTFQYEQGDEALLSDVRRYGSIDNVRTVLSETLPADEGKQESTPLSQARGSALEGVSFRVEPGQLVALVGPSGAGKTTLTYLIPRLYDPSQGRITLDGHDLRAVSLASLSGQIGMVTQETYLFHDTIRTNLLYARLDASQKELEDACRSANIHNFIQELPERYNTVVGERGYRLSGGEKQRIALARVILKNPRILVLDEATSSLDSESEALIQEALGRVMAQRTSIVIAHRLSTIMAADLILVIDRGQVVERGSHSSLLKEGGLYAQLYRTQFRKARVEKPPFV
ncbi:MAG: ABC transporter ATP-binding protein [Anaerolineaceae bacterium]|nr:ABC transporter ATP-binding protein [Anaerolineaceae bacterium]